MTLAKLLTLTAIIAAASSVPAAGTTKWIVWEYYADASKTEEIGWKIKPRYGGITTAGIITQYYVRDTGPCD